MNVEPLFEVSNDLEPGGEESPGIFVVAGKANPAV
jgi:hypothetical protein